MSGRSTNSPFALLLDDVDDDPAFQPLTLLSQPEPFEELFPTSSVSERQGQEEPETYERHQVRPAEPSLSLERLNTAMSQELDELRQLVCVRDGEIEALKAKHTWELEEKDSRIQAEALINRLKVIDDEITDVLACQLAIVLEPFVANELRARAINEFVVVVSDLLCGGDAVKIVVRGPKNLLAIIGSAGLSEGVKFESDEAEAVELLAKFDDRIISTRFQYWSELLSDVRSA
jgi:hypothetical protein